MDKYIYDENNGLWYELQDDYYIPCLVITEEERRPIGVWGYGCPVDTSAEGRSTDRADRRDRRHLRYIREYRKGIYNSLLLSGKLNGCLANLNEQVEDMFFRLVKEFAEKGGITETLKAENQMLWVQRMNAVQETATEIVNNDLVFA